MSNRLHATNNHPPNNNINFWFFLSYVFSPQQLSWLRYKSDLLKLFVRNNQAASGVPVTDVPGPRGCTDVDISLLFYLRSRAGGRTDVVKCFKTFFHGGKSGWSTFIENQLKLRLWQGRGRAELGGKRGDSDLGVVSVDLVNINNFNNDTKSHSTI